MEAKLINFKEIGNPSTGILIAIEQMKEVPFEIKRVYYLFDCHIRRGFHAHKKLKQVAIAINGSCKILLDDGTNKEIVLLNKKNQGLFIEGGTWREMYDFSADCVLMVIADSLYDEQDYIRDYQEFINFYRKS